MRHKLILAGGGSGTAEYLLPAAKKALEEVELVIASPRFLELLHARKTMPMGHISELLESLPAMLERESIGIVVSGDPLLYSLCRTETVSGSGCRWEFCLQRDCCSTVPTSSCRSR